MKNLFLVLTVLIFVCGHSQSKKELKAIKKELKVINNAANEITMKIDDFDNTITWASPSFGKGFAGTTLKRVIFNKTKNEKGEYHNYLRLTTYGSTLNMGEKGLILLFEDGSRFEKPNAKIDANPDSNTAYWQYSIFIEISDAELEIFASKKIDKFRLYIYDGKPITKKSTLQVMGYAKGIKESQ